MSALYLENLDKKLEEQYRYAHRDGTTAAMIGLLKLIASILPEKVTPEELAIFIRFIVKDIESKKCGFLRSRKTAHLFKEYLSHSDDISRHLTWLPGELKNFASSEFITEFSSIFAHIFFSAEETIGKEDRQEYGCIEIDEYTVDISNKNRAEVLAALYNNSKPLGNGVIQYDPTPMTVEIAEKILEKENHFSYLKGRVMYITFTDDDRLYVGAYNRDNDRDRLAQRVISELPNIPERRIKKPKEK